MTTQIRVLSRHRTIECFNNREPKRIDLAIISINSTVYADSDRLVPRFCTDKVLYLHFDDIDQDDPNYTIFNKEHAEQLCDFWIRHDTIPELVIHCTMGISRSAACAAAIWDWYEFGERALNPFFQPPYIPNRHVYRTIMDKVYG